MRQHFPLTARFVLIKEGIDDTAEADHPWSTKLFSYIYLWADKLPFRITHIAGIMGGMRAFLLHGLLLVHLSIDDHPVCSRVEYIIALWSNWLSERLCVSIGHINC